jgi:hypothetical protein
VGRPGYRYHDERRNAHQPGKYQVEIHRLHGAHEQRRGEVDRGVKEDRHEQAASGVVVHQVKMMAHAKLRVADERQGRIGSEPLRLLSLNEAPVWECEVCGEDADWICTFCMYERENPFNCKLHAEDHDCEEPEMLLPVVNSPRMGMCGYEGPE